VWGGLFLDLIFYSTDLHFCFLYQYYAVFVTVGLKYDFKLAFVITSALLFLLRIARTIQDLLCSRMYFDFE
jgi:hypothetical protein